MVDVTARRRKGKERKCAPPSGRDSTWKRLQEAHLYIRFSSNNRVTPWKGEPDVGPVHLAHRMSKDVPGEHHSLPSPCPPLWPKVCERVTRGRTGRWMVFPGGVAHKGFNLWERLHTSLKLRSLCPRPRTTPHSSFHRQALIIHSLPGGYMKRDRESTVIPLACQRLAKDNRFYR